jgi:hypothetical protein
MVINRSELWVTTTARFDAPHYEPVAVHLSESPPESGGGRAVAS